MLLTHPLRALQPLALVAACTPAPSDGFHPSESFLAASQNCDALQAVSDQHCGEETFAAYCAWNFSYGTFLPGVSGYTELPVYTCETAGDIATQRAADEDKLLCELQEYLWGGCETIDTGNAWTCSPKFFCLRQ